ncbi:adenosine kinase [Candidatus Woesearchaeota archaeon]|nr:adenosine kinase [Candidatus Woesearchaeota archaeon]
MSYDVMGIGNPLIDLLIQVEDNVLVELNLTKGQGHLVSEEQLKLIEDKIKHLSIIKAPGDSSANTLAGVANLGGTAIFVGKVGLDPEGTYYEMSLINHNVIAKLRKVEGITGKALTFITPGGERTFVVHLGVADKLHRDELLEEDIAKSKILHLTGYQLEAPTLKETALHAMQIAKAHHKKISIDLADPALIARNKEELKKIVQEYASIIFVNETEAKAFTGKDPEEALNELARVADIAIVKLGERGSLIKQGNTFIKINVFPINCVDTTGAGDMYAAGVLYGITHGLDLELSGNIGSLAAAHVVAQVGARLPYSLRDKILQYIQKIEVKEDGRNG